MLKMLRVKENIDISNYKNLIDFVKSKNKGIVPKKSNVFSKDEINRFLTEAPDKKYLLMKASVVNESMMSLKCY